jgi:hypothetical protein
MLSVRSRRATLLEQIQFWDRGLGESSRERGKARGENVPSVTSLSIKETSRASHLHPSLHTFSPTASLSSALLLAAVQSEVCPLFLCFCFLFWPCSVTPKLLNLALYKKKILHHIKLVVHA